MSHEIKHSHKTLDTLLKPVLSLRL